MVPFTVEKIYIVPKLRGTVSWDEYLLEGLLTLYSVLSVCADGPKCLRRLVFGEKNKVKYILRLWNETLYFFCNSTVKVVSKAASEFLFRLTFSDIGQFSSVSTPMHNFQDHKQLLEHLSEP